MSLPALKPVHVCFLLMQPFQNVGITKVMNNSHTLLSIFTGVQKHLQIPELQILYWSSSYPVIFSTSKNLKGSWGKWIMRSWVYGFCVSLFWCMVMYYNCFMMILNMLNKDISVICSQKIYLSHTAPMFGRHHISLSSHVLGFTPSFLTIMVSSVNPTPF